MGHANLSNICEFFLKRLYAKGKLSIKDCTVALVEAGETVHASEGEYEDENMLAFSLEEVVRYLLEYWENSGSRGKKNSPVIEPVQMSDDQSKIYSEWIEDGEDDDWDTKEFDLLDSVQFRFCKGWRARYKEVELLGNVTN
jgi:hypothetical protein